MSEVVVIATYSVRPGQEETARAALAGLVEQTHGEAGCLGFALHDDPADPRTLVMVERWESPAALENHARQPYVTELAGRADELLAAPPHVRRLTPVAHGDPGKGVL